MGIALEVLPIGRVAITARTWRHRGRSLFTAIVKVTCRIEHDGQMSIVAPAPIAMEERHFRNNPVASLIRGSDLALLVPRPEVVLVGSAYAAPGRSVTHTTVRFAVQRDTTMLINKRLEIFGDRRARPGAEPPTPAPFERMPIQYERALGGIVSRDNPVGVGMGVDADGLLTLPNVEPPGKGGVLPAGFGPIPSAWPVRQKRRGSLSWSAANESLDLDVPDDFDDGYYQTAPPDQQTQDMRGGDLIAIVNMHPEIPMLRTYLPKARGVALAQTARGDRIPLQLRIDTVHIEPDTMRAEIVYRAAAVVSERDLTDLRLAGTIEEPEAPFNFPDLSTMSGLMVRPSKSAQGGSPSTTGFERTAVIDDQPEPLARRFSGTQVIEFEPARDARPAAPPAPPAPKAFGGARGLGGTMIIEPEAPAARVESAKTTGPLPPPIEIPISAPRSPRRSRTPAALKAVASSTLVIEPDVAPQSLPFEKGKRGPRSQQRATRDGTPWGAQPLKPAPPVEELPAFTERRVLGIGHTMPLPEGAFDEESTYDHPVEVLEKADLANDSAMVTPKAPQPPAPKSPEPKSPEPKSPEPNAQDAKRSPWRDDPAGEKLPSAAPAAKARVAPPRANLKGDLYKKLKR